MSSVTDIEPIAVHITGSDLPAAARRRRRRALRTNTYILTAANPTQAVLPQADTRVEAWITSAIATPPTLSNEGSVTNPGAFTGIAFSNSVGPGTYQVTATVYLSGTVTAADANNMQITGTGFTAGTVRIAYPGVANQPVTITAIITTTGTGGIGVQSVGAASGAAAVYNASIEVTPLADTNPPVIFVSSSQAGAQAQAGGAAQIAGIDTTPFPVNTTDQVWISAAGGYPVTVSVLAIYEENE